MPAVQETIERVRRIDVDQYKYGFVTDIGRTEPEGPVGKAVRFILGKRGRGEVDARRAVGAYRRWLTMREPTWARVDYPKIDYQDAYYYSAPKKKALASLDEVDPEILRPEARHSAARAGSPRPASIARRGAAGGGRRRVRFRFGRDDLPGRAEEGRRDLHADVRRSASTPIW